MELVLQNNKKRCERQFPETYVDFRTFVPALLQQEIPITGLQSLGLALEQRLLRLYGEELCPQGF